MADATNNEGAGTGNTGAAGNAGENKSVLDNQAGENKGVVDPKVAADKAVADKAAADKAAADKAAAPVPVDYTKFTLPEGITLDQEALKGFKPIVDELKLTQEQAQKLVTLQANTVVAAQKAQAAAYAKATEEWIGAVKADPEIGGANFDANLAVARRAREHFGNQALVDMLNSTGMGNHPEVVRFFYKVGKTVTDDKLRFGKPAGAASKTLAERMFPNQGAKTA